METPGRRVSTWGWVEKKREAPTSLCWPCAGPGAEHSDPAGQGQVLVSGLRDPSVMWAELESSPRQPVPRAQVYTTSPEWGRPQGVGGRVCTEGLGPAGSGTHFLPEPCQPAIWPGASGDSCANLQAARPRSGPEPCNWQPPRGSCGQAQAQEQARGSGRKMESQPLGRPVAQGQGSRRLWYFLLTGAPSLGTMPLFSPPASLWLEQQLPRPSLGLKVHPYPAAHSQPPGPSTSSLVLQSPLGIYKFHMKYCAPSLPHPAPELPEGPHSLHTAQATSKPNLGFIMYIIYILCIF